MLRVVPMIRSLEGLRGIAALLVALYHLGIGASQLSLIRNGYLFVDLFFVLSGYIMCAAYAQRMEGGDDLRVFLVRRIGRLFPLLVFSTLAFVLLANLIVLGKRLFVAQGHDGVLNNPQALEWLIPSAAEIVATLTLTHGLGVFDRLILNTPSWSISVEFYAYLLFAALCLGMTTRARMAAFAFAVFIGAAISVWASITVHDCLVMRGCMSLTYDFGFPRAVYGFFLGVLVHHARATIRGREVMLQWLSLGLLGMTFAFVDGYPALAFGLPPVFALLIMSVGTDAGPVAHAFKPRPLQRLGQWSYSIYLMHMPLLLIFANIAGRAESTWAQIAVLVTFVALLLAVSAFTYRYVEDPMRARFNRLALRRAQAVDTPRA